MHGDLIGQFKACLTAKDMWDSLRVRFGQTSGHKKALYLALKVDAVQDELHSCYSRRLMNHMSAMIYDLKAAGREISKEEQVLNVIRVLPTQPEHWKNVKLIMTHSEHMKTFVEIQSHFEMGEERLKTFSSSNAALVAKGNHPQSNKNRGRLYKKAPHPYQNNGPKSGATKKAKGNGEKNIA